MAIRENAVRAKKNKQIREGTYDLNKLEVPRHYAKELEKNLKLIERYGKENGLSNEQITMLKEVEIIGARQAYLEEKNEEAERTGDIFARRDIKYNNEEIDALNEQYLKRESALGNHVHKIGEFIEKQNTKTNGR